MRAADWPSSSLVGGGGGFIGPRTASYKSIQTVDGRTCAIDNAGGLDCWGDNSWGQVAPPDEWRVGANEVTNQGSPLSPLQNAPTSPWIPHVSEQKKKIISLSSQSELFYLCVVIGNEAIPGTPAGDVHCYGDTPTPTLLGTTSGASGKLNTGISDRFVSVKASDKMVCAVTDSGQLMCVGDSPVLTHLEPEKILLPDVSMGTDTVIDYALGTNHACVILNDQGLYCWGSNDNRQLGVASPGAYTLSDFSNLSNGFSKIDLTSISGPSTFLKVYASDNQTCAIGTDEAIFCWGRGQPPIKVSQAGWKVKSASIGLGHSCMVYDTTVPLLNGRVACAGTNTYGQLGRGTTSAYEAAVANVTLDLPGFPELTDVATVSVGQTFTCAVKTDNTLWCWGRNSPTFFEIDLAVAANYTRATATRSSNSVSQVVAGNDFQCSVRAGALACSGANIFQTTQEGGNTSVTVFTTSTTVLGPYFFGESPGTLTSPPLVSPMASNNVMSCATTGPDGELWCWGQFYDPNNPTTPVLQKYPGPVLIPGLETGVYSVTLGLAHACAIRDGALYCWGSNSSGQINGNTDVSIYPDPQLIFQTGVTAVAAGAEHTCAIVAGEVLCWGGNSFGQVGAGRTSSFVPYPYRAIDSSLGTIRSITAGWYHTCALLGSPVQVTCWGSDSSGQLGTGVGDGTTSIPSTKFDVDPNYTPEDRIVAGFDHTCVKARHNTLFYRKLFCWGGNNNGELGVDPALNPSFQTPHLTSPEDLSATNPIAAHGDITCFTVDPGGGLERIYCMGDNITGALGKGYPQVNARTVFTPEEVMSFNIGSTSIHLAPGGAHLCYDVSGIFCIGNNANAQLGNGKTYGLKEAVPKRLFANGILEVALGSSHTCALANTNGGELHCWGMNRSSSNRILPLPITDEFSVDIAQVLVTGVEHVAAYGDTTCISKAGEVRCWGKNDGAHGKSPISDPWIDYDAAMSAPPILTGDIKKLFVIGTKACAIDGLSLKCWGDNTNEALASGPGLISVPVTVSANVETAVLAEWGVCYAATGPLDCQVSPVDATADQLKTDIQAMGVESIQDLSVHPWTALLCATTTDGKLYCGGDPSGGVLNYWSATLSNPGFHLLDSDSMNFSMSNGHACTDTGGTLVCTGSDSGGQVGNGDEDFNLQNAFVPVEFQ